MHATIRSRAKAIRKEAIERIVGYALVTGLDQFDGGKPIRLGPYRIERQYHRDQPASIIVCKGNAKLVIITAAGSVIPEADAYESKIAVANLITTLETYVAIGRWSAAR